MFFAEGRYYLTEKFNPQLRCYYCGLAEMTMQRLIDRLKQRTYVRLDCPCGASFEWSNPTDPEHDYYASREANTDNGHLTDDQAKRLADLIQFIDQEENQQ